MEKPNGTILDTTPLEDVFPSHERPEGFPDWMPSTIFVPDLNVLSVDYYWAMGYDYAIVKVAEAYAKAKEEEK